MALIALCKLSLQMRMCSNPLALHVWFLVRPFVYFHTLCMQTAKALSRLLEPSLFACAISTIISWAGSYVFGQAGLGKQCRPRSGSSLFAILSASFGLISLVEPLCSNFRIITAIFRVSKYLGILWCSDFSVHVKSEISIKPKTKHVQVHVFYAIV